MVDETSRFSSIIRSVAFVGQRQDLPFLQMIFLAECHLAGTAEIADVLAKMDGIEAESPLALRRPSRKPSSSDDTETLN